ILGVWAVAGLVMRIRSARGDRHAFVAFRRQALWFSVAAGVVIVVCWIQPLIEQFTSDGDGNLTRLVESSRSTKAGTIGVGLGTRVVASVLCLPPWWFRHSMRDEFVKGWDAPPLGLAVLSLVVLCALLGWCVWDARRRSDRTSSLVAATAAVGLVGALITSWRGPGPRVGGVAPHTLPWLLAPGGVALFPGAAHPLSPGSPGEGA